MQRYVPASLQTEFAKKIKEKYPDYKDVDDLTLSKKMIEKYPEYKLDSIETIIVTNLKFPSK